ncbi:uncharacterized protein LOC131579745 isoform X1 [Poecile atricapillus]|uniref:uncharacterized protein LOC131579745 isoform X1 n=1 Tax=Poecile atricapillus TaxID=48891 RepID=UPI002739154F|nr:uncharacterized protein LOC131579745 isoform X1 [Poecile atricapillus]XP_058696102.1 uncharacterized protein LOC131579745 isoform X1 [Poecile atricapillus]XP_058696111.1 uncharacterized protein LOC131579745 isoform X1 [Poecile atricapillus]
MVTPAVYFCTGGGSGRGMQLWGILMSLSLAMCSTKGMEPEAPPGEGPLGKCEQCQTATKIERLTECPSELHARICWLNGTQFKLCKSKGKVWCSNSRASIKEKPIRTSEEIGVAMTHFRNKREIKGISPIAVCEQCNKTVWIGRKKHSTFLAYHRVNPTCYNKANLKPCMMGGKLYWEGKNVKHEAKLTFNNEPIILDLLKSDDENSCLQFDPVFCFSKDEEGLDPESKIKQIAIDMKRQEMENKKKRLEQERLNSLSKQYELLEKQYDNWKLPSPDQNLFVDLMQEIATELGLSNCWICGGLKSAERWPWKGEGLTPEQLLKWTELKFSKTTRRPEGWVIDDRIIGTFCISREGKEFTDLVGYTPCVNTLTVNSEKKTKIWQPESPEGYWIPYRENNCEWIKTIGLCWNKKPGANPFHAFIGLRDYW